MTQFSNYVKSALVDRVTEDNVSQFVDLSRQVYPDEPINDLPVAKWKHLESPNSPSAAVEVSMCDKAVGRIWLQRHSWTFLGTKVSMMFPQDLVVVSHARRAGLVLGMLNKGFSYASSKADFVFHSSNNDSEPLYKKLFKFAPVCELNMFGIVLRPFSVMGSRLSIPDGFKRLAAFLDDIWENLLRVVLMPRSGGVTLTTQPPEGERQEEIIAKFLTRQSLANSRDQRWRTWRFSGAGAMKYETFWIYQDKEPLGYVVLSHRERLNIRATFVVDLVWSHTPSKRQVKSLWRRLLARLPVRNSDLLLAFGNLNNPDIKQSLIFPLLRVPAAAMPQRFPIYVRAGDALAADRFGSNRGFEQSLTEGFYMLADLDVI